MGPYPGALATTFTTVILSAAKDLGGGDAPFPQILRCSRQANPGRGEWHAKFYETRQRHPVGALPVKTVGSPARPKPAGRPVANPACVGVIRVRSQEEQGCRPRDRAPKSDDVVESRRHAARPEGSIPLRQRRYAGEPTGVRERGIQRGGQGTWEIQPTLPQAGTGRPRVKKPPARRLEAHRDR
jgi:hypothetical protein